MKSLIFRVIVLPDMSSESEEVGTSRDFILTCHVGFLGDLLRPVTYHGLSAPSCRCDRRRHSGSYNILIFGKFCLISC